MVLVISKNSMVERFIICRLYVLFIVVFIYRRFNCKGEVIVREVDCVVKFVKI